MQRHGILCRITRGTVALAAVAGLSFSSSLPAQMQMPTCHSMGNAASSVAPADLPAAQKIAGAGNLHFPISSKNPETQAWFDQGINLVYDFWDYEADRAFEQAIRTDPSCAICHWALAQSLSSQHTDFQGYAHDELMKAVELSSHADKREKMYIAIAQAEAKENQSDQSDAKKKNKEESSEALLRKLVKKYPHDETANLMLSDAVSDGYQDGQPRKGMQESIVILQAILKEHPDSSAANHLWIHAVEASPHPEQALHSARILATLSPASGHMTHMPGHIFYRTGDYQRAQVSFDLSTSVDEAYMKSQHVAPDDDWNYVHNLMYSIANLLESGRVNEAAALSTKLPAARGVRASTLYPFSTRDSITRLNPLLPVALRSSDWKQVQALLTTAHPPETMPHLQLLTVALATYARGMQRAEAHDQATARTGSTELDAQLWRLQQQMDQEKTDQEKADKAKSGNPQDTAAAKFKNLPFPTDPSLSGMVKNLAILSLELRGAILIEDGKIAEAQKLFAQARHDEQDLGYHEPPAFIRPVAEQEAELLMQAAKPVEAGKAYQLALEDRPASGYPLYGLAQVAEKSGNVQQTHAAYESFLAAWKNADPGLPQLRHAEEWIKAHPDTALALATAADSISRADK